jgi:hypothetical protein
MTLRSKFRTKFSGSSLYPFMRKNYRFFSSILFSALRTMIELACSLIGIRVIFPRYAVIALPLENPTIVIRGFTGITLIGRKHYFSRKQIVRNYLDNPLVQTFVSDVLDISGVPVCPVSILETALIKEGVYKPKSFRLPRKVRATHSVGNDLGRNVYVPMESSFFHFYIQVAPYLLRNTDSHRLMLDLDSKTSNREILLELGISIKELESQIVGKRTSQVAMQFGHYPSSTEIQLLRRKLIELGHSRKPQTNYYVTRRGNLNGRRIKNEAELVDLLGQYHFEVIDPGTLNFKEQLTRFSKAKIVVAPHGAALSHIVNFPASAKVLELNGDSDVRWHIRKMARNLGVDHFLLLGKNCGDGTFLVNLELVKVFLEKWVNES